MRTFLFLFMAQALTFKQIIDRSYTVMTGLLKTYVLGSLLLFVIAIAGRFVGSGIFVAFESPALKENLALSVPLFLLAVAFMGVGVIAQMVQGNFALVLAVDRKCDVHPALKRSFLVLWRIILGGIWIMLRSFAWIGIFSIPFLIMGDRNPGMAMIGWLLLGAAFICAIAFLPRLSFINVIQLRDGTGILESGELSLERTKGYWGKIVGNCFLFMLCIILTSAAIAGIYGLVVFSFVFASQSVGNAITLIVGIPLGLVAILAAALYFFGVALLARVYTVELYETIKAHPKVSA